MQITDRVFLITGAASGLGAAVARMVVAEGGKAMLLDLNSDASGTLAHELGAAARFQATDVTKESDGQAAVAATVAAFGRTISKTRGERLRHSGLTSEALFDELWQKRDVIAA